ncbi:MAG: 3-dehydroquinate synthase [Nitrospiraceae bacterium]|nr:3-dehydroquinate synthase [Nitrospiraceae bacterium]
MQTLRVELGDRSYSIVIGNDQLEGLGASLSAAGHKGRIAVVSNPTVFALYGDRVMGALGDAGFEPFRLLIPDGEEYKSLSSLESIYTGLLTARLDRKSLLVALGGGVIGDITGYAASTYMRGIDFVQVPTTLLAQVDSSVGGKTGVNHTLGKNMIGTFWQPRLVWIDIRTLLTLPKREFVSGLAEVIKYGVIWDREFFDFLETGAAKVLALDNDALVHVIRRSCEIKAEVVSKDEREAGLRAILNYGHTIGHAIETATGYKKYLHGEAVAIGMVAAARLSEVLGLMDGRQTERIESLVRDYGLPTAIPGDLGFDELLSCMQLDKKTVSGTLTFVLPEKISAVRIEKGVSPEAIRKAIELSR